MVISLGTAILEVKAIGEAESSFQDVSIGSLVPSQGFLTPPFLPECPICIPIFVFVLRWIKSVIFFHSTTCFLV